MITGAPARGQFLLFDGQGRQLSRTASGGEGTYRLRLDAALPSGTYILLIQGPDGYTSCRRLTFVR